MLITPNSGEDVDQQAFSFTAGENTELYSYSGRYLAVSYKIKNTFFKKYKFIYLFLAVLGLRCGAWASHRSGFSCCGALTPGVWASVVVAHGLQSAGSVVVAHGLSCSTACGILPDQGSNPCPPHWQADS